MKSTPLRGTTMPLWCALSDAELFAEYEFWLASDNPHAGRVLANLDLERQRRVDEWFGSAPHE
jgi:hypothetical protein